MQRTVACFAEVDMGEAGGDVYVYYVNNFF